MAKGMEGGGERGAEHFDCDDGRVNLASFEGGGGVGVGGGKYITDKYC